MSSIVRNNPWVSICLFVVAVIAGYNIRGGSAERALLSHSYGGRRVMNVVSSSLLAIENRRPGLQVVSHFLAVASHLCATAPLAFPLVSTSPYVRMSVRLKQDSS